MSPRGVSPTGPGMAPANPSFFGSGGRQEGDSLRALCQG